MTPKETPVSLEIKSKIYVIRGQKVMLDRDLAELYGVETRTLNQKVKRNVKRFPSDFMFEMTKEDIEEWKSQIVISNSIKMGLRKSPKAFTLFGVAMLSSVLNSETAIDTNIDIMRAFVEYKTIKDMVKYGEFQEFSPKTIMIQLLNKTWQHITGAPLILF